MWGRRRPPLYTLKWDSAECLFEDLRIISCKRNRIIRSPAILKRISTGLRIKRDVGDGDALHFIRKDEILRSLFVNLRTISSKKNEIIRNLAILRSTPSDLRTIQFQ